jgi:hypothetical protein
METTPTTTDITLTLQQVEAINRLGQNGWVVETKNFALERDGMYVGLMHSAKNPDYRLYVGITMTGSTHT